MPWTGVIDGAMVGVPGGVAEFGTEPVLIEDSYEIPGGCGRYVIANSGKATIIITLPDPGVSVGYDVVIKVTDASKMVEICPHGGEMIDGQHEPIKIEYDNAWLRMVSDGTNWYVVG